MTSSSLCGLLLGLLVATGGHAQDARVRSMDYAADTVVRVLGREGFQSSIVFHDDEKIENVAVGDSLGWQVTPNKRGNLLFLKPMPHGHATNMTVVTDKRVYLFDLALAGKSATALYSLRFVRNDPPPTAPAPAPATPEPAMPPAAPAAAPAVVAAAPQQAAAPAWRVSALNFAWRREGARNLLPAHVFDDGHAVYLDWRPDAPLPAILAPGPDGIEGPVNFAVHGTTIVVDGPLSSLVLRVGKESAVLSRQRTGDTASPTDAPAPSAPADLSLLGSP